MSEISYGYSPPRRLADNLWEVRGEWSNAFGRRMTVLRTHDGRVQVHNAIRLLEPDLRWLRGLGDVRWIVGPNVFHCSDAGWMLERFPEAELYVPAGLLPRFRRAGIAAKDVNSDFPASLAPEILCLPMQGTRIAEAAFLHAPSRTLVLCDLAFHMEDVFRGPMRWLMRWNGVGGRFGPSRLTRLLFARRRDRLVESYRRLLALDFDRVVVNHGAVLERGGREALRAGVKEIFPEL